MVERVFVGLQPHPSPPWRVGRKPLPIRTPAPTLGEHNRDVLSGMLGLVENELESLIEAGIIGTSPRLV